MQPQKFKTFLLYSMQKAAHHMISMPEYSVYIKLKKGYIYQESCSS